MWFKERIWTFSKAACVDQLFGDGSDCVGQLLSDD